MQKKEISKQLNFSIFIFAGKDAGGTFYGNGLRGKIPERFWGKILTPK
jgi:hypothetical protein